MSKEPSEELIGEWLSGTTPDQLGTAFKKYEKLMEEIEILSRKGQITKAAELIHEPITDDQVIEKFLTQEGTLDFSKIFKIKQAFRKYQ